ncbi:MAG: pentapeptide repeat-containing protein [Pseudomonadota bacterium]
MASLKDALAAVSDEKLEAALEKTAATVQQLTLTLLVVSAFAVSVAGTPDIALLLPDSAISVPTLGGMPLRVALIVAPIVLVAVRIYLQLYVNHWRHLNRVAKARDLERPVTMSPMRDGLLRVGTIGIRYALVPGAMAVIAWKALGDPIPLGYAVAMATVFVTLAHVIQDLPTKRFVWIPALILLGLGVLAISEPGQRHFFHRPLDLRYADLSRRVLNKADLRGADLELATLANSQLRFANLTDAYLVEATLTDAYLVEATLTDAYLEGANLTDADLGHANLTDADFVFANLTDAYLGGAILTDAYLSRATLTDAHLGGAILTDAYFLFAILTDAYLGRAILTDAYLGRAILTDAYLGGAILTGGTLAGSLLFGTDFRRSILTLLSWPEGPGNQRALAFVDGACFAPLILGSDDDGRPVARCGDETVPLYNLQGLGLALEGKAPGDVLVPATDLPTRFADYACVRSEDEQPLGPDGKSMNLKLCSYPDFRERMHWYYCGDMNDEGQTAYDVSEEYLTEPNPLIITTETCAGVGLGTDWERQWLEKTFPDFEWDRVPR